MTAQTPSFAQSTWLVAEREIGSKLRSKPFLISFGILFLLALGGVIWAANSFSASSTLPPNATIAK